MNHTAMADPIFFNVIVPTRERADTLAYCLRTIIGQQYPRFRIIVSDNCSQDGTAAVVAQCADPRITYVNPGTRLSMAVHWEFALSHVTEGWVMFIGDDDGLLPGALAHLNRVIHRYGVEAVNSAFSLFVWPSHLEEIPDGRFVVPFLGSDSVKQTKTELARALEGRLPYTKLPWLYNGGAASLALINRARDSTGRFFRSQTPDLYSAVALCLTTDRFLSVAHPIAVGGTSRYSTGAANSIAGTDDGRRAMALYLQEANIPFHPDLIMGKSIEILLYECYLQAEHLRPKLETVTLSRQLQVALEMAPATHYESIADDCRRIAERHGLAPPTRRPRPMTRLRRLPLKLREIAGRLVMNPRALQLNDVQDAATASHHIYAFARHGPVPLILLVGLSTAHQFVTRLMGRSGARTDGRKPPQ